MSKKKDPNLVLRDKRLRKLEFKRRRTVKELAKLTDEKTGKKISEIIVLPSFTANVDDKTAFGKKMLKLLEKQHRSMTVYRGALEDRMELIVKNITAKKECK